MQQLSKLFEQSQQVQARNITFQHFFLLFTRGEVFPGVELTAFGEVGLMFWGFFLNATVLSWGCFYRIRSREDEKISKFVLLFFK